MGKTKQQSKDKKFDRNVEISAPILDPEIIKAIHTPPKGQRLDLKHGGFKALLSDLNSQDSTDEPAPLNDSHVPSYIGISCAVSGYSGYSPYGKKNPEANLDISGPSRGSSLSRNTLNRMRAISPVARKIEPQVNHVTIEKNVARTVDEERRELTEKLTASATERCRSPSPCIPPTEDDRHHGAYVGARYCPLPPPSKVVNKHIPLLGIDDDQDPDGFVEDKENRVEQKIASLYGEEYVEDWRESMALKKELINESLQSQSELHNEHHKEQVTLKSPKDLVTLKPTPQPARGTTNHESPVDNLTTTTTTTTIIVSPDVEEKLLEKEEQSSDTSQQQQQPVLESGKVEPIETPQDSNVMDTNNGHHYLELLETETKYIMEQVERANKILEEQEAELDEDVIGNLRSAIGKANLLVNKKFDQFRQLCGANINAKEGEQFATLNDDLAGFWDMLSIQVSDVHKSFENLWKSRDDWQQN